MKHFLVLFTILFSLHVVAQDTDRYSEDDIKLQGQFVRAAQKKLLRKYDDAIEIYESILKKDMHNSLALYDLSRIYFIQENEDDAIEYAEKATKKAPQNEWYKESLAEIYMAFENYEEASKLYSKLAAVQKTKDRLYLNAVDAYDALNDNRGAIATLEKMEQNLGASAYTSERIIGFLLNEEDYKGAITKSKALINKYPSDPYFLGLGAELEKDFGSEDEAKKLFQRLLTIDPENSNALVYLASATGGDNKELANISSIVNNQNINIDDKVKALIPHAMEITAESANKSELINLAKQIATMHPEEAKAHALHGDILKNSGDISGAMTAYTESLKYDKSVFAIWQELMILQYESEAYEELSSTSMNAIDFYPNQSAPYAFNGLANANLGKLDDAKEMLMEAQFIGSSDAFVQSITTLLEKSVFAIDEGYELKVMTKEDIFMIGLKPGDEAILYTRPDGKYVVKVKKGS